MGSDAYDLRHLDNCPENKGKAWGRVLTKMALSEADRCEKFISPALQNAGWDTIEQIFREYTLRVGRVVVRGQQAIRDKKSILRADYPWHMQVGVTEDIFMAIGDPLLAEQRSIVTRVQQLRALCAQLRERLQTARATQSRLALVLVEQAVA